MEMKNAEKLFTELIDSNNSALERLNSKEEFSREWMATGRVCYVCQLTV